MFNLMPGEIEQAPSLSAQESPVREIEFEFVVFDPAPEIQFNPVGKYLTSFTEIEHFNSLINRIDDF